MKNIFRFGKNLKQNQEMYKKSLLGRFLHIIIFSTVGLVLSLFASYHINAFLEERTKESFEKAASVFLNGLRSRITEALLLDPSADNIKSEAEFLEFVKTQEPLIPVEGINSQLMNQSELRGQLDLATSKNLPTYQDVFVVGNKTWTFLATPKEGSYEAPRWIIYIYLFSSLLIITMISTYMLMRIMRQDMIEKEHLNNRLIQIINGFDSQIRDVAENLGKEIRPIQLESNINCIILEDYAALFTSFTHIFNNILDHGIEMPPQREEAEKTREGHITFTIMHDTSRDNKKLEITIADDGAGINPDNIRKKLRASDPGGDWEKETDEQIIQRIFNFGFSTKNEVSTLSGRGIGMDAVWNEVEKLGGKIHVKSEVSVGTQFFISI